MPEWYYRDTDDQVIGPLKPDEMLAMIRDGELTEKSLVRKDDSPWVPSVEVNGLWAAAARPETEFYCPVCNTLISKPPSRCPQCLKYIEKGIGRIKKLHVSAKQLAKIREAASQPAAPVKKQTHPNTEESAPIAHSPKPAANSQPSSRWWHSLLPRKK